MDSKKDPGKETRTRLEAWLGRVAQYYGKPGVSPELLGEIETILTDKRAVYDAGLITASEYYASCMDAIIQRIAVGSVPGNNVWLFREAYAILGLDPLGAPPLDRTRTVFIKDCTVDQVRAWIDQWL